MSVRVCGSTGQLGSGDVSDGLVLLETGPLAGGVVHLEHCVHQHGCAARAIRFGQDLCVFAQFDLDDVTLLWARVLCGTGEWEDRRRGQSGRR